MKQEVIRKMLLSFIIYLLNNMLNVFSFFIHTPRQGLIHCSWTSSANLCGKCAANRFQGQTPSVCTTIDTQHPMPCFLKLWLHISQLPLKVMQEFRPCARVRPMCCRLATVILYSETNKGKWLMPI